MVVHNGNAEGGHYYSYINISRGETETQGDYLSTERDPWLEFNDTIVREFDFKRLPAECFGGNSEDTSGPSLMQDIGDMSANRSKSAYMLFYERKLKSQIPEAQEPVIMHDFHNLPLQVSEDIKKVLSRP